MRPIICAPALALAGCQVADTIPAAGGLPAQSVPTPVLASQPALSQ